MAIILSIQLIPTLSTSLTAVCFSIAWLAWPEPASLLMPHCCMCCHGVGVLWPPAHSSMESAPVVCGAATCDV